MTYRTFLTTFVGSGGRVPKQLGLPTGTVLLPDYVKLVNGRLLWSLSTTENLRWAEPDGRLLENFARLAQAPDVDIEEFARTWGVLGICKHGMPHTHNPSPVPIHVAGTLTERQLALLLASSCVPRRDRNRPGLWSEQLSSWKTYANQVTAMISIAQALDGGKRGSKTNWTLLCGTAESVYQMSLDTQWLRLTLVVNGWLEMANVRPVVDLDRNGPQVILSGSATLFGAIALQMASVLTRADSLSICANCGSTFQPSRKPRKGQRSFCTDCANNRTYSKHAMRIRRQVS